MSDTDLIAEIRARAEAATPGPWFWSGNVDYHSIQLSARVDGWGTCSLVQFRRSGMQGAEPVFMDDKVMMHRGRDIAVYAVARDALTRDDPRVYRGDIVGFRNANAELIAHAPTDIAYLLAEVSALREVIEKAKAEAWDEGFAAADIDRPRSRKGHWEDTRHGVRTWIPDPLPVNPYAPAVASRETGNEGDD